MQATKEIAAANEGKMATYCIDVSDPAAWIRHLEEEGYVVLTGVFSPEECTRATDLFVAHYGVGEQIFTDALWPAPSRGMVVKGSIHTSDLALWARSHPNVVSAYSRLYDGTSDLVSAFDRANAVRNAENLDNAAPWLHVDFPMDDPPPLPIWQSFANFIDCTPADSPCLRVVPRSHTGDLWRRVQEQASGKGAAFRVPLAEDLVVPVLAPAGSLVVWRCGLVHDARTHLAGHNAAFGPLRRLNVYICLAPRASIKDDAERAARLDAFERGIVSTHWPVSRFVHHSPDTADPRYHIAPWDPERARQQHPLFAKLV